VIASHYAEAVERTLAVPATVHSAPSSDSELIAELPAGAPFLMLDDSLGWAWGYAGEDREVGYVPTGALGQSVQH
jgi:hypothetical protein